MAIALTGIVGDLGNLIPSSSDILQQVIIGAGATTVLAGMKTAAGQDALDPLHLFHHDQAPSSANNPNVVIGPTVTASAFAALPPATQQMMMSNGAHVVAG